MATLALGAYADGNVEKNDTTGFKFTDVKLNKTTPVKDQNKSGTCWSFSGIGFFEDELLRITGKEYDLSEMWIVRHCYADKADKYIRMDGTINFAQGGSVLDVPYVIDRYGIVPEDAYKGLEYGEAKHDHGEIEPALKGLLSAVKERKGKKSTAWRKGFNGLLDAYLGEVPESFQYEGKTYTPKSFAESFPINTDDYIGLTSFTHHPFYKPFNLEVSDNWINYLYYNIPIDQLVEVTENAINNGYSVAWAADVSEKGFNWGKGYANLPKAKTEADLEGTELARWVTLSAADREKETYKQRGPVAEQDVTQESRQEMFDRQETTDDHGMVIVGIAKDQEGNKWFKVKNSWTDKQIYGGYFYVSIPYFKAKTLDIYVNREAVPASILKELGLTVAKKK